MKPWLLVLLFSFLLFLFIPNLKASSIKLKNGWDALNFVLVICAILCGILSKNTNGGGDEAAEKTTPTHRSQHWYPAQEPLVVNQTAGIRRMRSSSSYPDLRQEAAWGDTWRFADDFEIYRSRRSGWATPPRDPEFKTIPVDTVVLRRSDPPPPSPPRSTSPAPAPPPPPPPPPPPQRRPRRQNIEKIPKIKPEEEQKAKEEIEVAAEIEKPFPPPSPAPPPPPLPPKLRKKSSVGAKDFANKLTSFYQKNKKKGRKPKKTHDETQNTGTPPPQPPPPPPPPPPSFTLAQLFSHKKSHTKKKVHSIPSPVPPPPPPPPPLAGRSKKSYKKRDQIIHPGTLPPPPPPPPPMTPPRMIPPSAMFPPPSPDVNNKADMFIARFRANLKLEKMNSIREKQQREKENEEENEQDEIMMMMMMGGILDDDN